MPSAAQESKPTPKIVAFVDDSTVLHTSSVSDVGGDGLNRLAEIFLHLGANTRPIKLDQPISSDIAVVVLVRPTIALPPASVSYLWDYLTRGGHLLVAFDPNTINKINSDRSTSGLNKLLWADYGIGMDDDVVIEPWFSASAFKSIVNTLSPTRPENVALHPILTPLLRYDIPVYVWTARTIQVDALGPNSVASPLLFTDTAFGETNRNAFRPQDPDPILMNIGDDKQGHLLLGGIAQNNKNGSKVVLFGDSELVQNIFGLTRLSTSDARPRYPGNYIFAQRVASWLLDLPEDQWPSIPAGFTKISIDGNEDDWDKTLLPLAKDVPDTNIHQIRAFYNDQYLYLLIDTTNKPSQPVNITIEMQDVSGSRSFVINGNEVASIDGKDNKTVLPDAAISVDQGIEMRLPRRPLNGTDPIISLCLNNGSASGGQNCAKQLTRPPLLGDLDLAPVRPIAGPEAFVLNEGNLRTAPDAKAVTLTRWIGRTLLKLTGRTEAGDWVKVYDGRWGGWISTSLLAFNTDIQTLPVLTK